MLCRHGQREWPRRCPCETAVACGLAKPSDLPSFETLWSGVCAHMFRHMPDMGTSTHLEVLLDDHTAERYNAPALVGTHEVRREPDRIVAGSHPSASPGAPCLAPGLLFRCIFVVGGLQQAAVAPPLLRVEFGSRDRRHVEAARACVLRCVETKCCRFATRAPAGLCLALTLATGASPPEVWPRACLTSRLGLGVGGGRLWRSVHRAMHHGSTAARPHFRAH